MIGLLDEKRITSKELSGQKTTIFYFAFRIETNRGDK